MVSNADYWRRLGIVDRHIKSKLRAEGVDGHTAPFDKIENALAGCVAGKKLIKRAKVLFGVNYHCIKCGGKLTDGVCVKCQAKHFFEDGRIVRVVEADGTEHTENDICKS